MSNAMFLLIINGFIGITFAAAFVSLAWPHRIFLGFYSAIGFLFASATVLIQALASSIGNSFVITVLSFSFFLFALAFICIGIISHYRPRASMRFAFLCVFLLEMLFLTVVYHLPRDSVAHAFGYQLPFAAVTMAGAVVIFRSPHRRLSDKALSAILAITSIQFVSKAFLAAHISTGTSAENYIVSLYAMYSQTVGAILSVALGVCLLVVLLKTSESRSADVLSRDGLSGLWTRRAFMDRAMFVLSNKRTGANFFLILCDLDHFKNINDKFGHAAGDDVIGSFATCIEQNDDALCGRFGGEEFLVLLRTTSRVGAAAYVEKIRQNFAFSMEGRFPVQPTCSFGIAQIVSFAAFQDTLRSADAALYHAKGSGRDTYCFAEDLRFQSVDSV